MGRLGGKREVGASEDRGWRDVAGPSATAPCLALGPPKHEQEALRSCQLWAHATARTQAPQGPEATMQLVLAAAPITTNSGRLLGWLLGQLARPLTKS